MAFLTNEKLTIVGAAGMIGSNMAQTALMMGLTSNLCLYDVFSPEGVAEEMRQCGFDGVNITATTDVKEAFTDAKYIISSGGAPRKAGMTREDLLKGNCEIAEQLGKDIKTYCPDVKHVVIIFNPADLTGREWTRIGTWPGYSGIFNGQGHRITGLNFSAATTELFGLLNERGVIKNLQLIDVNLYGNSGSAAGIVEQNNGQIIACSVTGKISAYGRTCGIADLNYGRITACWFDGTLKEYESGAIVRYNYKIITSCYWGGNVGQGVFRDHGEKVDATKVDGATVKWQTAVDGMNTALTAGDYQWILGTDGLPVLQKRQ